MKSFKFVSLKTALLLIYCSIVITTAWVSDDAYITFRSVENFLHKYGLVYNIGERVQTFTHPLWFFVLSTAYYLALRIGSFVNWSLLYYVCVFVSILISLLAVSALLFGIARSSRGALLAMLLLFFSKAFVDYSTSGLENPLSHFLMALFLIVYSNVVVEGFEKRSAGIFLLSFFASLMAVNRLDTFLFAIPALIYIFWMHPKANIIPMLMGQFPLIVWEGFSLIYYGRLFPNTAYAKLNTGINSFVLIQHGFAYFLNSLRIDPITLLAIICGSVYVLYRKKTWTPIVAGIALYFLYVFYIGGDFMSGRFFSISLFAIAAILSGVEFAEGTKYFWAVLFTVLIVGSLPIAFRQDRSKWGTMEMLDENKIADERMVYYPNMWLISDAREKMPHGTGYAGPGWKYDQTQPVIVEQVVTLGVPGYQAGPNKHIIDRFSLVDPLMVYMPLIDPNQWRIGHYQHVIPDGYIESLQSGQNKIQDGNISFFYDQLSLVTKGDLFTRDRWFAIYKLNTGQYDHLIINAFP